MADGCAHVVRTRAFKDMNGLPLTQCTNAMHKKHLPPRQPLQAQQKQRFRECGLRLLNMQLKFKSRDFYQLKLSW